MLHVSRRSSTAPSTSPRPRSRSAASLPTCRIRCGSCGRPSPSPPTTRRSPPTCYGRDLDLVAVYFEGIDMVGHRFQHCMPPAHGPVPDAEYEKERDAVAAFYEMQDEMIGRLVPWPRAGPSSCSPTTASATGTTARPTCSPTRQSAGRVAQGTRACRDIRPRDARRFRPGQAERLRHRADGHLPRRIAGRARHEGKSSHGCARSRVPRGLTSEVDRLVRGDGTPLSTITASLAPPPRRPRRR